jgi:CBS domain-containing protein
MSTPNLDLHPLTFGCAALIGVVGGLLAMAATGLVYLAEDSFGRLPIHWMWWPAIGGLVIGLGGLVEPRALGVGYDVIRDLLQGHATLGLIVGILVVKTLIWGISLGSGTSGGVLAPTFMIGAALGAMIGQAFPSVGPGFWALLGLASVLGGVMRSPLTGIVFSLELTHLWDSLLPVATAAVVAYLVSALLLKRSVLTEKVARRGFHLTREYSVDPLEVLFAREVMISEPITLPADQALYDALIEFTSQRHVKEVDPQHQQRLYPVVRGDRLVGLVSRSSMLDLVPVVQEDERTLADVMVCEPVVVYADHTLREVANLMAERHVARAPVVDRDDPTKLLGLISVTQLLQGRLHDLEEERVSERVLMLPAVGRRWRRVRPRRSEHSGGASALRTE